MKYRKLRIVWSVAWGVAGLLLIALWVRSYRWVDGFYFAQSHCAVSKWGELYFDPGVLSPGAATYAGVTVSRIRLQRDYGPLKIDATWNGDGQVTVSDPVGVTPIWVPTLLFAAFAPISWVRWRFSLRTLLIAMTLVAVGLGFVAYELRG